MRELRHTLPTSNEQKRKSNFQEGRGGGGAAAPLVGFCYYQSEIYQSVIFRNQPILDNKEFLSLMCICCFVAISEVNLL